jgi:hypothetical protein
LTRNIIAQSAADFCVPARFAAPCSRQAGYGRKAASSRRTPNRDAVKNNYLGMSVPSARQANRMKCFFVSLFAVVALSVFSGCASQVEKDTEALQGSWVGVIAGEPSRLTFDGTRVMIESKTGRRGTSYALSEGTPARILFRTRLLNSRAQGTDSATFGVYSIGDNKLNLCLSLKAFPQGFGGRENEVVVLHRVRRGGDIGADEVAFRAKGPTPSQPRATP